MNEGELLHMMVRHMINEKPLGSVWDTDELVAQVFKYQVSRENVERLFSTIIRDRIVDDCTTNGRKSGRTTLKTKEAWRLHYYERPEKFPGFLDPPSAPLPSQSVKSETISNRENSPKISRLTRIMRSRGFRLTKMVMGWILGIAALGKFIMWIAGLG